MVQRSSTTAFAKSTRPEIGGVVRRELLFARLDGMPARTVAWISAPPGFGKTTLAASYLEARSYRWAWYQVDPDDDDGETFFHYVAHAVRKLGVEGDGVPAFGPEHRDDLAGFSRRFFRALFSRSVGLTALVLDNLHELSSESPLRTILEAGLPQVPRGCCVIVTSRAAPPVKLSRLQASDQMVFVAADELRITPGELAEMARLRGKPLAHDLLLQLHQRADGWAAALVLMVEHYKLAQAEAQLPSEATPKVVFDYLAGEIFERFEPPTQRFLLQLACLPRITIDIARALSGDETAARVLFNLAHNDYFVRELVGPEGRVFVFHPLLREFLLYRAARDLPHAVGAEALRRAARLLRESGQHEDALALYVERRDWAEVAAIAKEQADALLAQGRHATLAAWLEVLPPEILGGDADLLRACGFALAYVSPRAARRRFEQAFDAFRHDDNRRGMARCCLGIIDTVLREFDDLGTLDRWLGEFDRCRDALDANTGVSVAAIAARMWREPGHPSVAQTSGSRGDAGGAAMDVARSAAALLGGDFVHSATIAKGIEGSGGAVGLALATVDALRALLDGDLAAALVAARAGLAIGAVEAAHGHDAWLRMLCAAAAIGQQDAESARVELDLVAALPLRRGDQAFLHYLRFGLAQLLGNPSLALREARSAALLAVEAGLPWLECLARVGLAHLLAASGDHAGCEAQVRSAQALAQRLGSPLLRLATLFTHAAVAVAVDDEPAAVAPLQAALALARELGVHYVPGLPPESLATLCAVALRRGIAIEHTRKLISAGKLAPPASALRLRRWPWAFEVVTLGNFDLRHGGDAIEFSAKGPGRPVELLKVLISLGGQNVRADQLADALWPNVDADYAHKSFTATLHRLRRIFGEDDAVKLRDGRLGLNASMFWLDTWALDQVLVDIEACFREGDERVSENTLRGLVDEALSLYLGPFLLDEAGQPAFLSRREQLRARLLRALARAARRWEENGRGDAAVDCYLRCIDADEQCEAFYRNLMLCYQRRGDPAEALATYERLQVVLSARSRSMPSAETQAVYARLRA
jgi:LuxR family maltose regulon positive regulatory protein